MEDILRGVRDSLAERAGAPLKRVRMQKELTRIGGVASQRGMVKALEECLQLKAHVPENRAQYTPQARRCREGRGWRPRPRASLRGGRL